MKEKFKVDLVLIVIDTFSAAVDINDGNDTPESQRIFNGLNVISRETGAFVLVVDHFGKAIESGTRGTSAKEDTADVILALLADRDINGNISNTRMTARKVRGGKAGAITPFDLVEVDVTDKTTGEVGTTCIIEWKKTRDNNPHATGKRVPKSLKFFQAAMVAALARHGELKRPVGGINGPQVMTVTEPKLWDEFRASYAADNADTKRKAYTRALKDALAASLIESREIDGIDHIWLPDASAGRCRGDQSEPF
jgi:AAA domain